MCEKTNGTYVVVFAFATSCGLMKPIHVFIRFAANSDSDCAGEEELANKLKELGAKL